MIATVLAAESSSSGSPYASLIFLFILGGAFYFIGIRPQRNRIRQAAALQQGLEVGQQVMTTAGLHGAIRGLTDDTVELEIAPGVVVTHARGAVGRTLEPETPAADAAE